MTGYQAKSRTRVALAWMMAFALLNVITVCPVLAHQVPATHACCEHSQRNSVPCTDTTPHNCPYLILEKSQAKAGILALLFARVAGTHLERIRPTVWCCSLSSLSDLENSSPIYLQLRVLRI